MKNKRLLIYELNEVPKKVIIDFIKKRPSSTLACLIKEGSFLETYTSDQEELHPWSTWPTVYRGVNNKLHNIRFINQDLNLANNKYPPVWEILEKYNINIGIFGTLQSYPPKSSKNYNFYIPDTFAPTKKTHPESLNSYQDFNLQLSNENKAQSNSIGLKSFLLFSKLILSGNISKITFLKILIHMANEMINKDYKKRRSFIQNLLGFGLYFKLIKRYKPSFTTFFTNHVASTMHRYWKDTYPNDYTKQKNINEFNSKLIFNSMELVDSQLKKLKRYCEKNNSDLWVISSMGQKAIERGKYIPETTLTNFENLIKAINLPLENYKLLPAMQPDICIKCKDNSSRNLLKSSIKNINDLNNQEVLIERYSQKSLYVNYSISTSINLSMSKKVVFKNKIYDIKEFGLKIITRDQGTAYHSRDGIFISNKNLNQIFNLDNNDSIDTRTISQMILSFFKIPIPLYMNSDNHNK